MCCGPRAGLRVERVQGHDLSCAPTAESRTWTAPQKQTSPATTTLPGLRKSSLVPTAGASPSSLTVGGFARRRLKLRFSESRRARLAARLGGSEGEAAGRSPERQSEGKAKVLSREPLELMQLRRALARAHLPCGEGWHEMGEVIGRGFQSYLKCLAPGQLPCLVTGA